VFWRNHRADWAKMRLLCPRRQAKRMVVSRSTEQWRCPMAVAVPLVPQPTQALVAQTRAAAMSVFLDFRNNQQLAAWQGRPCTPTVVKRQMHDKTQRKHLQRSYHRCSSKEDPAALAQAIGQEALDGLPNQEHLIGDAFVGFLLKSRQP